MVLRSLAAEFEPAAPAGPIPVRNQTMAERASSDPLLRQFFAQLPPDLRTDFTDRQLAALKRVFGDFTREGHAFDVRLSLPVTPRGVYLMLLGGRDVSAAAIVNDGAPGAACRGSPRSSSAPCSSCSSSWPLPGCCFGFLAIRRAGRALPRSVRRLIIDANTTGLGVVHRIAG